MSSWILQGCLNPMTSVRHRGEGHVKIRQILGLHSHKPRNVWSHLKAKGKRKDPPLEPSRGCEAFAESWFQTSGLQNCETMHVCCLKPSDLCNLLWLPWDTNIHLHVSSWSCKWKFMPGTAGVSRTVFQHHRQAAALMGWWICLTTCWIICRTAWIKV